MRQIVETILPTTMVGSYPRPKWFHYQLLGKPLARMVAQMKLQALVQGAQMVRAELGA